MERTKALAVASAATILLGSAIVAAAAVSGTSLLGFGGASTHGSGSFAASADNASAKRRVIFRSRDVYDRYVVDTGAGDGAGLASSGSATATPGPPATAGTDPTRPTSTPATVPPAKQPEAPTHQPDDHSRGDGDATLRSKHGSAGEPDDDRPAHSHAHDLPAGCPARLAGGPADPADAGELSPAAARAERRVELPERRLTYGRDRTRHQSRRTARPARGAQGDHRRRRAERRGERSDGEGRAQAAQASCGRRANSQPRIVVVGVLLAGRSARRAGDGLRCVDERRADDAIRAPSQGGRQGRAPRAVRRPAGPPDRADVATAGRRRHAASESTRRVPEVRRRGYTRGPHAMGSAADRVARTERTDDRDSRHYSGNDARAARLPADPDDRPRADADHCAAEHLPADHRLHAAAAPAAARMQRHQVPVSDL